MEVISNTKGGQPTPKRHLQIQHEKSPGGLEKPTVFACFFMLVHIRLCSQVYHQIQLGLPPSSRLHIFQNPIFFLFANLTKAILGLDFRPLILPLLRHLYQLCVWFILIQDLRLIFLSGLILAAKSLYQHGAKNFRKQGLFYQ